MNDRQIQSVFQRVLERESRAISQSMDRTAENSKLVPLIRLIQNCSGRCVFIGMGKMGAIARKAAGTFASTGTPSLFVQPSEALHGDLGMITARDIVLALSYSGETDEILNVLEIVRPWGVPTATLTGNIASSAAKLADFVCDISVAEEAIDAWPVPTCSTTLALATCDALAIAIMEARGFSAQDFASLHPGGNLGRQLRIKVSDLMHRNEKIPVVSPDTSLRQAIAEMSRKSLGATLVGGSNGEFLGVLTDGDVRRTMELFENPLNDAVQQFMSAPAKTCRSDWLAAQAMTLMEANRITILPVVDPEGIIQGVIHFHDLVQARLA